MNKRPREDAAGGDAPPPQQPRPLPAEVLRAELANLAKEALLQVRRRAPGLQAASQAAAAPPPPPRDASPLSLPLFLALSPRRQCHDAVLSSALPSNGTRAREEMRQARAAAGSLCGQPPPPSPVAGLDRARARRARAAPIRPAPTRPGGGSTRLAARSLTLPGW